MKKAMYRMCEALRERIVSLVDFLLLLSDKSYICIIERDSATICRENPFLYGFKKEKIRS